MTTRAWQQYKLGDLLEIKHGHAFQSEHFSGEGNLVLLTPGNFREDGGLKFKGGKEKFYTGAFPDDYLLRRGDLLVAMTDLVQDAPILGSPAFVPGNDRFLHNQRLGKVVNLKLDVVMPEFLYWVLNTSSVREQIKASASGATVRHTSPSRIYEVVVSLPSILEQRRIANVLSAYDQLTENNRRRIWILEEMAGALYREWFVNLRFPGNEKVSPVESAYGKLPEGWRVESIDAIKADERYAINGGPFGSKLGTKDYTPDGVPVIRGNNLSLSGRFAADDFVFVSEDKAIELRANLARPGDIVVTQRGTLGQIGMIPPNTPFDRFVISQSQMKITVNSEKASREYIFFFLRSAEATQRLVSLASSSGVPHINLAVLREFPLVLPPLDLQRKFGEFAQSTQAAIESLNRKNDNLRRTRDLLLPRLLSGQVLLTGD